MRLHAQCTLLGQGGTYTFLNVAGAAPGSIPSVANSGFVANAAGTAPLASDGTTAARPSQGQLILGLDGQHAIHPTRAHVKVTTSGVIANPPTAPARRHAATANLTNKTGGGVTATGMIAGTNAVAVPAGATLGRDVIVSLFWGTQTSGGIADDFVTTGGCLLHVEVFADDDQSAR